MVYISLATVANSATVGKWQYLYFDRGGDKGISGMQRLDEGIL